jgi:hypothetical protein
MPLHLQPRDLEALIELGDVGLMSSDQLFPRHYCPPGEEVTRVYFNRRMRAFAQAKLVDKTSVVLSGNKGVQKQPAVYRLTPTGADEVEKLTGIDPPRVARSDAPSAQTLLHRTGVTETLLAFKDAAKKEALPPARWLLEGDREPTATKGQTRDKQFILVEAYQIGRDKFTCRPDACVAIERDKPRKHTLLGYIEYDRSTEGQDQILRTKTRGYEEMLKAKTFKQHWPNVVEPVARILFVCKSKERIRNLQEWLSVSPISDMYRFTLHEFLNENLLRAPVWWRVGQDLGRPGTAIIRH